MKYLKYLLFLLLIAIIAFAIYVAVQPNNYDVKRTKLIKAPVSMVFNKINDYKNWESWGPWYDEDSTIVATYADKTSGVGGSYSWTSKDGPGNMKTIDLVTNKSITQKMQFDDYEPNDVYWTFDETEEGTSVTWGMKSESVPFMFKLFGAISGGMDNMLGTMEEKGLNNLANVVEEQLKNMPKNYRFSEIMTHNLKTQKFIGYHHIAKMEDLPKLFAEYMPKAGMHAMSTLKYGEFTPAAVYKSWDEEKGETELYIGLLLKKNLAPAKGMTALDLPAGKTLMLSKFGNYGDGDYEAHMVIDNYMKTNNLTQKEVIWELYVNDPTQVKPIEVQTDIYYPVE
jgi:effector-binding domain-containing protein/uncharacterized protein YndB with AHSA1/START domain